MTNRIRGKVAGVLTQRELVINRGTEDGVNKGMKFAILNRRGIDVPDPDTGEILGSVEVVKAVVEIVRIDGPHLSVGRTYRKSDAKPGMLSFGSALYGEGPRVETLASAGKNMREEIDPEDSFVKAGDPVLQTLGNEYDDDF